MKLALVAAAAAALLAVAASPALAQSAPTAPPPPGAAPMTATATKAEAIVRSSIDQLRTGKLDTSGMTDQMAQAINGQLPAVQAALAQLGALKSITYLGEDGGADGFRVEFDKGPVIWLVHFDASGKVDGMGMQPEGPGGAQPQPQG
jgi:hypothetical protein